MCKKLKYEFVILLLLLALCGACVNPPEVKDKKITVAVSIYPLLDWVENIGGKEVEVICLLPPGASPHTFEPSPQVIRQLQKARILFKIGRGIDDWGDKIIRTSNRGEVKIVTLSDNMPELPAFETEHLSDEHEHTHFIDPHIWLDPVLAQTMVLRIADELSQLAPEAKKQFSTNAENYIQQLKELHQWIEGELSNLTQREFIAFHSSFTYFAARYGLKQVAIIELSPGKEPTIQHIAGLIDILRGMKKKVVFAEPQLSDKAAQALAADVKAPVAFLDPLGNPDISDRKNYISLMKYNVQQFKKYLQ